MNALLLLRKQGNLAIFIFIWGITFHHLKYLDKPIKCLEMRAKIKLVRKINEFFLCIFIYIWKLDIFSTYLNFDEKWFFCYFKSQISKLSYITSILQPVLAQGMQHGPSNKLKKKISSKWSNTFIQFSVSVLGKFGTLCYLAFKITDKLFFVKIEVCGKNAQFSNISENTKENLINFPDWSYFCSHF